MPLYRIRRVMPGITTEQLDAASMRAALCIYLFEGRLRWHRSYFDPEASEIQCIYEASTPDDIREHSRLAHIPCDEVTEVTEVLPDRYMAEAEAEVTGAAATSAAPGEERDGPTAAARS